MCEKSSPKRIKTGKEKKQQNINQNNGCICEKIKEINTQCGCLCEQRDLSQREKQRKENVKNVKNISFKRMKKIKKTWKCE